ncbi:MAG: winged helix-turn-helix domain-containing protein [Pseudomonadota bacterium]
MTDTPGKGPITLGDWLIDAPGNALSRGGETVRLSPKAMEVLLLLVEHQGQVVSRAQLLESVWPGRVVVEESVTQAISELRKALGDRGRPPKYIQTIPKTGYRLVPPVAVPTPSGGEAPKKEVCLAVLPFEDLSERRDQGYFCEGMADELIGGLSQISGIKVMSRTASFRLRHSDADAVEIALRMGVSHLVEGSVRRQGEQLRVHARLVELPAGHPCWSARFDRSVQDVFAVQDEIAMSLVQALQTGVPGPRARNQPALLAYDHYLRGRQYFYRGGSIAGRLGQQMFQRAIDVDPNYALAHAGLADMYTFAWLYYFDDPDLLDKAEACASRALQLAPDLAEAHSALGSVFSARDDYQRSSAAFLRAIELSPTAFEPNYLYGRASLVAGEFEAAASYLARASKIRPESIQVYTLLARACRALGREVEEREAYATAHDIVRDQLRLVPDDTRSLCVAASCSAALGSPHEARALALRACQTDDPMNFYSACALARAGFEEDALAALERAVELGWNHLRWLENDPELDCVRDTDRFRSVHARLLSRLPQ